MYIPIGPSKKQLYKIILLLLCLLFGFKSCVKADVYSCLIGTNSDTPRSIELPTTSPGYVSYTVGTNNCTSFNNKGNGYIYFIVKATPNKQNVPINRFLNMIEISTTTNWKYQCEYGTFNGYIDNQNSSTLYSVKCPVSNFDGSGGSGKFSQIKLGDSGYFNSAGSQGLYLDIGPYIMFVTESDTDIINAMNSNTQAIINAFSQNQTQINNIQNNTQNISDNINSDNVDNNQANSFFNDFSSNTPQGLVSLINKPLDFLNGLYNTCSPISVYVPYFDFDLTLPCISTIQNGIFDIVIPIARIIINGLICYRLVLGFINIINKLKDPNDSDIEVVDL